MYKHAYITNATFLFQMKHVLVSVLIAASVCYKRTW